MRVRSSARILLVALLCVTSSAWAQLPGWTDWIGASGSAQLRARLREKAENARHHSAAVEVEVRNVWLNYPEFSNSLGITQAALEYQLDNGPATVTVDTRLRFEKLAAGSHTIGITLIGADDKPILSKVKLEVSIP